MGQPSPYFDRTWADVVPTELHVAPTWTQHGPTWIQHSSNINTAPTWSHDSCWQMQWGPRAPRFAPKRRSRPVASAPRIYYHNTWTCSRTTCTMQTDLFLISSAPWRLCRKLRIPAKPGRELPDPPLKPKTQSLASGPAFKHLKMTRLEAFDKTQTKKWYKCLAILIHLSCTLCIEQHHIGNVQIHIDVWHKRRNIYPSHSVKTQLVMIVLLGRKYDLDWSPWVDKKRHNWKLWIPASLSNLHLLIFRNP